MDETPKKSAAIGRKPDGKFGAGNPGKPHGAKSERVKQWEILAESITGLHADRFNTILKGFMESGDPELEEKGCHLFLQALEYFKPKQARVTHAGDQDAPVIINVLPNM